MLSLWISLKLVVQNQSPYHQGQQIGEKHAGRRYVLGIAGQFVIVGADTIHHGFDGLIEGLEDGDQEDATDQQAALHPVVSQPQAKRNGQDEGDDFLTEGFFLTPTDFQSSHGIAEGGNQAGHPS